MASISNKLFKSQTTIDVKSATINWYYGESVRSELVTVKGINVKWYV